MNKVCKRIIAHVEARDRRSEAGRFAEKYKPKPWRRHWLNATYCATGFLGMFYILGGFI